MSLTGRDTIQHTIPASAAGKKNAAKPRMFFASNVLASFDTHDRLNVVTAAYNAASAVKENVSISAENFDNKEKLVFRHQIVFQKKFTFSIACFLLFFIGAPLGAIIRKGGLGMPAVISTVFFILYWIISFTGEKYAADGQVPVWQGMWLASAVLLPIGIFLTRKATNDASLLDVDSWIKFFQKVFRIQTEKAL